MTPMHALRFAALLAGFAVLSALAPARAWARAAGYTHADDPGVHYRHAHHRHSRPVLRYRGSIPIFPSYGGCTDPGSPYWPCQTTPY